MTISVSRKVLLTTACALGLASGLVALVGGAREDGPGALPAQPGLHPVTLLRAQPFSLDTAATHWFRAERPTYTAGYLLVLDVDPALVEPRQDLMPVLYAGAQTLEPVNFGHLSGKVIAILPAPAGAAGGPDLDLSKTPLFFGQPELAERVDAARAQSELAHAVELGVVPPSQAQVEAALTPRVDFASDADLRVQAADLIELYAPQEQDLISGLRAPRVK